MRLNGRRCLDDRDAGRRARRPGRGARRLRDRRARVARQAQPDHAAAALPRVAEGAGAGAGGAVGGAARGRGEVAIRRAADARRRERRGPRRGGRRAGGRSAARTQTDLVRPYLDDANPRIAATAAVVARRQRQPGRSRSRRDGRWRACRRRPASRSAVAPRGGASPCARSAIRAPACCSSRCCTIPTRRSPPRRCGRSASAGRATSCSCRRWSRCCAIGGSRAPRATSSSATATEVVPALGLLPARPRGGRLGAAPHPRRRWRASRASVDGRAGRGARGEKDGFLRYKWSPPSSGCAASTPS